MIGYNTTNITNNTQNSIGFGWNSSTPDILFAKTNTSYLNGSGATVIGGTTETNSNVGLDLQSTTRVFKTNNLTSTEETNLTGTAGMIIFNTTTNKFRGYDGTAWQNLN